MYVHGKIQKSIDAVKMFITTVLFEALIVKHSKIGNVIVMFEF